MERKNRRLYVLLILLFLAITTPAAFYVYQFLYPAYVASKTADAFFGALRENDLKAAFQHGSYFDTNSDVRPSISYRAAEELWVTRVGNLKKQGIYLKSYSDIKTWTDDAYPVGWVNVTIVEDGRANTYRAPIHFSWLHGKMKIQAIYPSPYDGALDGFEGAISGNLVPEEGAREGKKPAPTR
ncbi:MAG: hypothetical protein Q8J63_07985 [Candidatus Aquicultor sp.]|nr:hypothetical protein [Candidatus Aquicultor sp.]